MKKKTKKQKLIEKLMRQHDKIEDPKCYMGICQICNKLKELEKRS